MTSREAFEAWFAASGMVKFKDTAEAAWQAAIQYARDVAVKACESRIMGDHNREDQEAQRCADAIKEALK